MKFLIILLFSLQAFATLNDVDKTQIYNKNILSNGGFENGKAQWTASAGTFAVTTTSPMIGKAHATWDAAASADTLSTSLINIPAGMYGRNGVASCLFTTASGTSTHTIQAYDGTNILSSVTITSSTSPTRASANFIMPTGGSIALRVYANADEPSVAIDDCYLGPAEGYNLGLAKPQDVFSAKVSSADVVSDENVDFINGNCTDADAGQGTCTFVTNFFSVAPNCQISTADTQVIITTLSATTLGYTTSDSTGTPANAAVYITCQKTGTDALQSAYKPDTQAMSWSGYHDNTCSWARTSTSYGDPTADATCALVERTNQNFGTVTTYTVTNPEPGIVFTPKKAGKYYVCASIIHSVNGTGVGARFQLIDESSNIISTGFQTSSTSGDVHTTTICGVLTATSTSAKTLKIQSASASATVTIATVTSGAATNPVEWSIFAISQSLPAPLLVNSVVSKYSGVTGSESAEISCATASSITQNPGSWLSSIGNRSTAACALTIAASVFSATPYSCQVTVKAATVQATACSCSSATACTIYGASADYSAYVTISGPR